MSDFDYTIATCILTAIILAMLLYFWLAFRATPSGRRSREGRVSVSDAKGDCAICKAWVDDGIGGACVFAEDYWKPNCPYDKEAAR